MMLSDIPCPQFMTFPKGEDGYDVLHKFKITVPAKDDTEWGIEYELRLAIQNIVCHKANTVTETDPASGAVVYYLPVLCMGEAHIRVPFSFP